MMLGLAAAFATGCSAECLGTDPRCDVGWPGGRLSIVVPFAEPQVDVSDDDATLALWLGRADAVVDHGTDWSADVVGEHVLIGVPDASAVHAVPLDEPGAVPSAPVLQGLRRFGEVLRTVPEDKGTTLYVGAPGADLDRGALYRFPLVENVLSGPDPDEPVEPDLQIVGQTPNDRLGANVTVCGDIDGDGVLDLVLGLPTFQVTPGCPATDDLPANLAGAVAVLRSERLSKVFGTWSVCDLDLDLLWGTQIGEQAGTAVACSSRGLYVGAPWRGEHGAEDQNAGAVYRVPWTSLPADGPLDELGTIVEGPRRESGYGLALASFSFTGTPALLVGAPGFSASDDGRRRGLVDLLVEDDSGLRQVASVAGLEDGEQFGRTLLADDLDGNGVDDVVLGSPDVAIDGDLDVGRLWLWRHRDVAQWVGEVDRGTAEQIIEGPHAFARVGRKLSRTIVEDSPVLLVPTRAVPATR